MKVTIEGLTKSYDSTTAISDVTTIAEEGQLTTLVGPSGCGKTTTMRCIAGLERPDLGTVKIGERVVTDLKKGTFVAPQSREVGMVFQTFDVWAHMTVFDNVAFPLRVRDYSKSEIEEKVMEMLELASIEDLRDKNASELSGGQQARVGITRALVYEPKVLLCDEPLTGLDKKLRERLRYEIRELQRELGITTVYVTHSQPEAMAISDKICLMGNGKIEQEGDPIEIYNKPISQYALDFFGSSDFFTGRNNGSGEIQIEFGLVQTGNRNYEENKDIVVAFRPEMLEITKDSKFANETNTWKGTVRDISFLGEMSEYGIEISGVPVRVRMSKFIDDIERGDKVNVHIDPNNIYTFQGDYSVR